MNLPKAVDGRTTRFTDSSQNVGHKGITLEQWQIVKRLFEPPTEESEETA